MSQTRKIAVVVATLVVAIGAGWVLTRDTTPPPWATPAALDGRYDTRYDLTFDGRVPGTGRATAHLGVRGRLDVTPLPPTEGARWFAARFELEAVETDDGGRALADFGPKDDPEGLGVTWALRLDDEGRVGEVRTPEGTRVSVRGLFAALGAATQLVRPRDAGHPGWEADEKEVNGPYRARYVEAGESFTKTWAVRTEGNPEDPSALNSYEADGQATFVVAATRIERVTVAQSGSVSVGGHLKADRARYDTAYSLVRSGDASPTLAASVDPSRLVAFSPAMVAAKRTPPPAESFDTLLEAARQAGEKKEWQKRVAARTDLTRLVASDDRLADRTATMIRAGGHSEPVERTLIEALVGAATPAAQGKVAAIISDRKLPQETRVRVLQGTTLLTRPGPEVVKALEDAAFAPRDATYASLAAMTLGAAALHLRERDAAASSQTSEKILAHASALVQGTPPISPTKPARPGPGAPLAVRTNWIGALGNAGDPNALPILLELLKDKHATIRASAAHSLRFMDAASALPAMERAMHDDRSITVRHALLHAARTMGPQTMEAFVTKALIYDVSEHVRLGAAYTMAMWAMKAPGLRRTLAQALALEKSSQVQESLRNYLDPGRIAPPFRQVPDTEPILGGVP